MAKRKHVMWTLLAAGTMAAAVAALPGCSDDEDDKPADYLGGLVGAKEMAEREACMAQLGAIRTALKVYSAAHDGLPGSLKYLVDEGMFGSNQLRCPHRLGKEYVYIAGLGEDMSGDCVLVYEPEGVHQGKCNVLLLDGQIPLMTPEEVQAAVAETERRIRER
jgi:prepilin-type processing-associated H-X9-DG protein